jgi:predicted PurR-regulated permease PerM
MVTDDPERADVARFTGRVLIVLGLMAILLILWHLRDVLLLIFAGILFAIILSAATRFIQKAASVPRGLSLAIASVLILTISGAAAWIFGHEFTSQFSQLLAQLPAAWAKLQREIGTAHLDVDFREQLGRALPDGGTLLSAVRFLLDGIGSAASGIVLALLGGVYLAAQPDIYRRGLLLLVPRRYRGRLEETMEAAAVALRAWLLGQLVAMTITTVAITGGLIAIGVPSPLALGLIAGLMAFVPMVGPLLGAVPGLLVTFPIGGETLLLTAVLYFTVQQLVGAVIKPLIMQQTVNIPPATTLFALFAIGALLGPVGVLLGGPLTVTGYVLVRHFYVRDTLGHRLESNQQGEPASP